MTDFQDSLFLVAIVGSPRRETHPFADKLLPPTSCEAARPATSGVTGRPTNQPFQMQLQMSCIKAQTIPC
jgi:hypothetical protein